MSPPALPLPGRAGRAAARFLALVLLLGVIGQAARDLDKGEVPRRSRDLLRVLVRIHARESEPRLDPCPSYDT